MTQRDSEGHGSPACCSAWRHRVQHSWAAEQEQQQNKIETEETYDLICITVTKTTSENIFYLESTSETLSGAIKKFHNFSPGKMWYILYKAFTTKFSTYFVFF